MTGDPGTPCLRTQVDRAAGGNSRPAQGQPRSRRRLGESRRHLPEGQTGPYLSSIATHAPQPMGTARTGYGHALPGQQNVLGAGAAYSLFFVKRPKPRSRPGHSWRPCRDHWSDRLGCPLRPVHEHFEALPSVPRTPDRAHVTDAGYEIGGKSARPRWFHEVASKIEP
jgi:hypothetical protein